MNRRTSSASHRRTAAAPTADSPSDAPDGEQNPPLKYNECQEAVEKLTEFLSHELSPESQTELTTHLHECKGCFSKFSFEETLLSTIREQIDQISAPPALRDKILHLIDVEAAAP